MTLTPMREEARDDAARPDAGIGLSRRRVLQGMAWATPAVVIASATPASAASQDLEPGDIVIADAAVQQNLTTLTVTATTAALGNPLARQVQQPVNGVTTVIPVPTSRVGAGTPTTDSVGWIYVSSQVVGPSTLFTYQWVGGDVTPSTPTGPLVAQIPKTAARTPFAVSVQSFGTSAGQQTQSPDVPLAVGAFSVMTSNWSGIYTQGVNTGLSYLQGGVLVSINGGNTAPVVDLTLTVRVLASATEGGGAPASGDVAWTYQGMTVSGSYHDYVFAFNAGTLPASYSPTSWLVHIPRKPGLAAVNYTATFSGRSPDANGAVTTLDVPLALN